MISMFALIMALGIIVDDAVVVGENAAHHLSRGESPLRAAVHGAREMFAPVFASTFTTISSFLPLFIIGGIIGAIIRDIPSVIVCILIAALFECFLILPGHLYHSLGNIRSAAVNPVRRGLESGFVYFQEKMFRPLAVAAVRFRLPTLAACAGMVVLSVALFAGGQVKFRFFPGAEFNIIDVEVVFAAGTSQERVEDYVSHLDRRAARGGTGASGGGGFDSTCRRLLRRGRQRGESGLRPRVGAGDCGNVFDGGATIVGGGVY